MAHGLAQLGHQIYVISRGAGKEQVYQDGENVTVYRILPRLDLSILPLFWRLNRLWEGYRLAVSNTLRSIVHRHNIQIIESPELHAEPLLYLFSALGSRPPLVVRLHSGNRFPGLKVTPKQLRHYVDDWAEQMLIRRANAITSPSLANATERTQGFTVPLSKCVIIPNPVDLRLFRSDFPMTAPAEPTILFIGRLEYIKGIDVLLAAIPQVCAAVPTAKFTFVGAGMGKTTGIPSHFSAHEASLFEQNQENLRIINYVPRKDLVNFYRQATLCVFPSRWESFGYVCAEAMGCSKPVVASRIGGFAEMVEDGVSGLLVKSGNSQELAIAIIRLLQNPTLRIRMGEAARQRVEKLFAADVVIPQMAAFYQQVLTNKQEARK